MPLLRTLQFIVNHPLNKRQRLKALWRFASWQVRSRISKEPTVCDWLAGTKFFAQRGEGGVTGNIYAGLHEFEDMAFVLNFLRHEDLFVDIGANVGSFTILASGVAKAKTIAFEPVPGTFRRLLANIELNVLTDVVTAVNKAVGAQAGEIAFTNTSSLSNHAVAPGENVSQSVVVPVVRLDDVLEGMSPTLIKVDVEGFETEVLAGGQHVLDTPTLNGVLLEMIGNGRRYGIDEATIPAFMARHGFLPYSYDPFRRDFLELSRTKHHERNVIFLRDIDFVRERVASAPKVEVLGQAI